MSVPHPPSSPDEKDSSFATTPLDSISEIDFSYTEAEEKRVRLKLNLTVLPLLSLGFYVFQLERGNISNALTDGFLKKVGITQDQFQHWSGALVRGHHPGRAAVSVCVAVDWTTGRHQIAYHTAAHIDL